MANWQSIGEYPSVRVDWQFIHRCLMEKRRKKKESRITKSMAVSENRDEHGHGHENGKGEKARDGGW